MRSVGFLLLIFMLSDGPNNVNSSDNQPEMFPHVWPVPCQKSQHNNRFNAFMSKHILLLDFETSQLINWGNYLLMMGLCERPTKQSFLHREDIGSIIGICNSQGFKYKNNMCISKKKFLVYVIQSTLKNGECEFQIQIERSYVIVACEAIHNFCLPVHYETQTTWLPSNKQICRP
ncbi:hypothetical protein ABG768_019059 [Culter alburnus]|uniref:Uncharacterized protein n=1 Tax=Culter alburnus TaxID=194366 RepID=A0AAW2AVY4_CULAL